MDRRAPGTPPRPVATDRQLGHDALGLVGVSAGAQCVQACGRARRPVCGAHPCRWVAGLGCGQRRADPAHRRRRIELGAVEPAAGGFRRPRPRSTRIRLAAKCTCASRGAVQGRTAWPQERASQPPQHAATAASTRANPEGRERGEDGQCRSGGERAGLPPQRAATAASTGANPECWHPGADGYGRWSGTRQAPQRRHGDGHRAAEEGCAARAACVAATQGRSIRARISSTSTRFGSLGGHCEHAGAVSSRPDERRSQRSHVRRFAAWLGRRGGWRRARDERRRAQLEFATDRNECANPSDGVPERRLARLGRRRRRHRDEHQRRRAELEPAPRAVQLQTARRELRRRRSARMGGGGPRQRVGYRQWRTNLAGTEKGHSKRTVRCALHARWPAWLGGR